MKARNIFGAIFDLLLMASAGVGLYFAYSNGAILTDLVYNFGILSNLVLIVVALWGFILSCRSAHKNKETKCAAYVTFKIAAVTGLIINMVATLVNHGEEPYQIAEYLLCFASPALAFITYLFFDSSKKRSAVVTLGGLFLPVVYLAYMIPLVMFAGIEAPYPQLVLSGDELMTNILALVGTVLTGYLIALVLWLISLFVSKVIFKDSERKDDTIPVPTTSLSELQEEPIEDETEVEVKEEVVPEEKEVEPQEVKTEQAQILPEPEPEEEPTLVLKEPEESPKKEEKSEEVKKEEKKPAAKKAPAKKQTAKNPAAKKPATKKAEPKKSADTDKVEEAPKKEEVKTQKVEKKEPAKKPASKKPAAKKAEPKKEVKKIEPKIEETTEEDDGAVVEGDSVTSRIYHVSKRKDDGKWQVRFAKGQRAIKLFKTQAEAIEYAKQLAINHNGSIRVHSVKGKIRKA